MNNHITKQGTLFKGMSKKTVVARFDQEHAARKNTKKQKTQNRQNKKLKKTEDTHRIQIVLHALWAFCPFDRLDTRLT